MAAAPLATLRIDPALRPDPAAFRIAFAMDTDRPVKDSYRALLQLRADGEDISDLELQNYRREEEVIRCAWCFPQAFRECGLVPAHFLAPVHALAWQAYQEVLTDHPGGAKLDPGMLISKMRALDETRLGGPRGHNWLMAVLSEPPIRPADVLQRHVKDVRALHRNRRWARRYAEIGARVQSDPDIAGVQTDYVRTGLENAFAVEGESVVDDPIDHWDWNAREADKSQLVKLGYEGLDDATGGLGRGEMLVWGGGTGHGKSYSAAGVLRHQARLQQKALYIGCEDASELMYCRLVAGYAEPSLKPKLIRNREADYKIVEAAIARMKAEFDGRIWVKEAKKPTIGQVCELIRQYRYTREIDLVIVDYLQAITSDEPCFNKVQEMSMVTSQLKRCITESHVAGIVMSQYNRESYKDGTEPGLNSCKYCGDIENEAEVMVLLWRDVEKQLKLKIPKVKWSAADELRFDVRVDPVSGWHREWVRIWEDDQDDDDNNNNRKKKR